MRPVLTLEEVRATELALDAAMPRWRERGTPRAPVAGEVLLIVTADDLVRLVPLPEASAFAEARGVSEEVRLQLRGFGSKPMKPGRCIALVIADEHEGLIAVRHGEHVERPIKMTTRAIGSA